MEIGDTIEMEEAGADEGSARSAKANAARRKNPRNGGKGRNGKREGDGSIAGSEWSGHESSRYGKRGLASEWRLMRVGVMGYSKGWWCRSWMMVLSWSSVYLSIEGV